MLRRDTNPRAPNLGGTRSNYGPKLATIIAFVGLVFGGLNGCASAANDESPPQSAQYLDAEPFQENTDAGSGARNTADLVAVSDAGSAPSPDATDPATDLGSLDDNDSLSAPSPSSEFGGFRITTLSIASPTLCVAYDEDCVNLQANINDILEDSFFSSDGHIDMVGLIAPSTTNPGSLSLLFQDTECDREDGVIVHCDLDEDGPHFQDVVVSTAGICEPDNPGYKRDSTVMQMGPCFTTATATTYVNVFGAVVPVEEAQILGTMTEHEGALQVEHGTIIGFISEEYAQSIPISIDSFTGEEQSLTLADVLHEKARALFNDTIYGWHVVFNFSAEQVPTQ